MKPAAWTVFLFAVYLAAAGVLLMVAPVAMCRWLQLVPPDHPFWVRLSGMLMLRLAIDFIKIACTGQHDMIRWSALTRQLTLPFLAVLVAVDGENPIILLFGAVDVAASLWTAHKLGAERGAITTNEHGGKSHVRV